MNSQKETLTFREILVSTLAAAFGVQTRKNMERDFSQGEVLQFLASGMIFTIVFVVGMIACVNYVLS
ncbi:MAG: DUF2970 domain-containing protein [Pseudomonadales bacterium]|nr:DUF2970 domain-containing protein [Pseudomonadales bacterium]